jgi:hypothetical protein
MVAAEVISAVKRRGVSLTVDGGNLELRPASALTPELISELREHKTEILETFSEEVVSSPADVLTLAREVLLPLKEEDRVGLQELIEANTPPEPGRDPLTKHDTDKAHFFQAPADCGCDVCMPLPRYATRRDGRAYRGGQA